MSVPLFIDAPFLQDDEADYHDSRRKQRHFDDELEAEVRAEKRIMNAKKVLLFSFGIVLCVDYICIKISNEG